ncbi:hypothetical protein QIU18_00280 [Capnocytophaga canimorsus]|nr:hypothetical protein [Capnocytophaga canimorsus]WGU68266.1 hypothetical protein QIU19_13525 [Capnocytophaga canimorsus]WGU70630.1 hypothetical protein QIU18_00280 [Capnocytophaga canimorsus]
MLLKKAFLSVPSIHSLITKAQQSIKEGAELTRIDAMMRKLSHKAEVKKAWEERKENNHLSTLLVGVKEAKAQFGTEAVKSVFTAVESKLEQWKGLSLEQQVEKLKFEIEWVRKHQKYSTWEVAERAYKKRLSDVKYAIEIQSIENEINFILSLTTKSASKEIIHIKREIANLIIKKTDSTIIQQKVNELKTQVEKINPKSKASKTVTLNDLNKQLGKKMPKTLLNLENEINNFKTSFSDTEINIALTKIKEVLDNGDLGMNVPIHAVDAIFNSYFKSQIETGTGEGLVNIQARKRASKALFGTNTRGVKAEQYEKYGFLMDKDILRQAKSRIADQYWQYGNGIQVRFKRNKVIATFTMMDSLGSELKPSLITDPKISSFDNYFTKGILREKANHKNIVESTQKYARSYIELQYHGDLTLDCVESVFIPEKCISKISKQTFIKMKQLGIKVYTENEKGLKVLDLNEF